MNARLSFPTEILTKHLGACAIELFNFHYIFSIKISEVYSLTLVISSTVSASSMWPFGLSELIPSFKVFYYIMAEQMLAKVFNSTKLVDAYVIGMKYVPA